MENTAIKDKRFKYNCFNLENMTNIYKFSFPKLDTYTYSSTLI